MIVERIGVKLCQHGRRGFLMTENGQMVHQSAKELLKGFLSGALKVVVVDCVASDQNLKLPQACLRSVPMGPNSGI